MLVLTRRIDEQIVLPDQGVTVTVLSVSGSRVKLGVSARLTRESCAGNFCSIDSIRMTPKLWQATPNDSSPLMAWRPRACGNDSHKEAACVSDGRHFERRFTAPPVCHG